MENNPTLLFVVAAALRNADGEILVQKRPHGKAMAGLWEFPGGKVDAGENPEAALIRELEEELGIVVSATALKPLTFASEPLDSKHLLLLLYGCDQWNGEPEAIVASEIKWVTPADLHKLKMPPADGPLVDQLLRLC
ncbi:8-oxo-dGTP diphosphatase MutT [Parasphingorhabdus sp.]|uniref:8-oxo-dGTP diphosphatase MutT n=1 Tax=Parasphingorhabdus sp. TaxID=2709688 RepID=UPI0032673C59